MAQQVRIIGRGTWLDKVAGEVVDREKGLRRDLSLIRVESGLAASGIPHIGSVGDAIRSYGIKLALEGLGYKSELIAFADDLDGLRKVPDGFPSWLNEHIAHPVTRVPDAFARDFVEPGAPSDYPNLLRQVRRRSALTFS